MRVSSHEGQPVAFRSHAGVSRRLQEDCNLQSTSHPVVYCPRADTCDEHMAIYSCATRWEKEKSLYRPIGRICGGRHQTFLSPTGPSA